MKNKKHNSAYYKNETLIKSTYLDILKKEKRLPTQVEVSKITGLSTVTICTHLKAINLDELINPFKLFGDSVLIGLKERAESGDPAAIKLYLMVIYKWAERTEVKADVNVKGKVKADVKISVSPKIAKLIGDELAKQTGQ